MYRTIGLYRTLNPNSSPLVHQPDSTLFWCRCIITYNQFHSGASH